MPDGAAGPQLATVLAAVVGGDLAAALVVGAAAGLAGLAGNGQTFPGIASPRPVAVAEVARELGLPRRPVADAVRRLVLAGELRAAQGRAGCPTVVEVDPAALAHRWRTGTRLRLPAALRCGVRGQVLGVVGYALGQEAGGRCGDSRARMAARLGLSLGALKRALAAAEGRFLRSWTFNGTAFRAWHLVESEPPPRRKRAATSSKVSHATPEKTDVPDHPTRRGLALVAVQPEPPAADDPIAWPPEPEPQPPATEPRWRAVEAGEQATAEACRTWPAFAEHLQAAAVRLHMATSGPAALLEALTAAGVYVVPRRISHAGRLGLRAKREALAELLARQGAEPSMVLEAAHLAVGFVQRRDDRKPAARHVGAWLRTLLDPKSRAYVARSRERVDAGLAALPMAAGSDALARLVRPQVRGIGNFVYQVAPTAMVASLRETVAAVAAVAEVAEVGGRIAAAKLRAELAAQRRDRQTAATTADAKRQRARIVGAVAAGDWRRVRQWMPADATPNDLAQWAGIALEAAEAGLGLMVATA